jgi:hypothetical protein
VHAFQTDDAKNSQRAGEQDKNFSALVFGKPDWQATDPRRRRCFFAIPETAFSSLLYKESDTDSGRHKVA